MILRHRRDDRVIGITIRQGAWLGGATLKVNGEMFNVACCASALQLAEALDKPLTLNLSQRERGAKGQSTRPGLLSPP